MVDIVSAFRKMSTKSDQAQGELIARGGRGGRRDGRRRRLRDGGGVRDRKAHQQATRPRDAARAC
jgi:hypothetical protein